MKKMLALAALLSLSGSYMQAKCILTQEQQEKTYVEFSSVLDKEDTAQFREKVKEFCKEYLHTVYMDAGRDMTPEMFEGLAVELLEMVDVAVNDDNVEKVVKMLRTIVDRYDAAYALQNVA